MIPVVPAAPHFDRHGWAIAAPDRYQRRWIAHPTEGLDENDALVAIATPMEFLGEEVPVAAIDLTGPIFVTGTPNAHFWNPTTVYADNSVDSVDLVGRYAGLLQDLLPQGKAWPRDADATLTKLLTGLAEELARVETRAQDLVREADPQTTVEMLADWERQLGLPGSCVTVEQTETERRNAVIAKLRHTGGQSRQFFIDLASTLGATITVDEFLVTRFGDRFGRRFNGPEWAYVWRVISEAAGPNELLECTINNLKPAHTLVWFEYGA